MKNALRYRIFGIAVVSAVAVGSTTLYAQHEDMKVGTGHPQVMLTSEDLKWGDGPPSLPPGAKAAKMEGDATKPGLFTMRLKLPANYKIAPHWHPADEHVTVISGTFYMGMGDKFDAAAAKELPAGAFVVMPAKHTHFAMTKGETIVQLHGVGPWGINYVNPGDDPRKKAAKK